MEKYFNFPIPLLKAAFKNGLPYVLNSILDYAIYKHSLKLDGDPEKQIKDSASYFNVTLGNIRRTLQNGESMMNDSKIRGPMSGINKSVFWDYYNNYKTEFEIVLLLAYLSVKSIIGPDAYKRITNDFMFCRMAGYNSQKEMEGLPEELQRYKTRKYIGKIKKGLKENFGLKVYGRYTHGFYVTFKLTFEQLVREIETNRKRNKDNDLKKREKEIINKVLNEV